MLFRKEKRAMISSVSGDSSFWLQLDFFGVSTPLYKSPEHVLHVTDLWVCFDKSFQCLNLFSFFLFHVTEVTGTLQGGKMHLRLTCQTDCRRPVPSLVSPEEKLCKDPYSDCVLQNSSLKLLKKDHCSLSASVIRLWLWWSPKQLCIMVVAYLRFFGAWIYLLWCKNDNFLTVVCP